MRAPAFWSLPRPTIAARLLTPAGAIYGAITAMRMQRPGQRCDAVVVCIGNFTAGGAGKTPIAITVAKILREAGEAVAFLSRGYGGAHAGAPLFVDPARHDASVVGDEPLLLARIAPTFVSADRIAGANAAVKAGAGVIIMDDGMQSSALHKDLTLAVIDAATGVGNGLCLPAGPLRAPLAQQLRCVDALIELGSGAAGQSIGATCRDKPLFRARLVARAGTTDRVRGQRVVAFAGIGRPGKFLDTLHELGADVVGFREFPDHHRFTPADLDGLIREAGSKAATLATTEKDHVRLPGNFDAVVVGVDAEFGDEPKVRALLAEALRRRRALP